MNKITIKSHAKINLGLNVIRRREDGFHDLETLFYPVELHDTISFVPSERLSFHSDKEELNADIEDNLIVRAVRLLEKESGIPLPVAITLEKRIPMGAGLGGGSSNAAVTLLSVNELFKLQYSLQQLCSFALRIGSDVPFFLRLKTAFATSRGEILTYFDFHFERHILLVNPGVHVSTKWAYQQVKPSVPANSLASALTNVPLNFADILPFLKNDFETPVFARFPEIEKLKKSFYDFGAEFALMSGSGSTVFGIFKDAESAMNAASHFKSQNYFVHSE